MTVKRSCRSCSPHRRGFSMLVAVGMMGIVTLAITATSAMFAQQAKRTRQLQGQAQQRQLEIARVLLNDVHHTVVLPESITADYAR